MCYNLAYLENKAKKLAARYQGIFPPGWQHALTLASGTDGLPSYYFVSGFSHPELAVVDSEGIQLMRWGLVPFWVKDQASAMNIQNKTLNAVGETVFQKPSFREPIKSRRCLLPVSGFFEWRDEGGLKQPYFIKTKTDDLFSLGCVYDRWTDKSTGEVMQGFSIITTRANELMRHIHNKKQRMPLILPTTDEAAWVDQSLKGSAVRDLIRPFMHDALEAYPVSRALNNPRTDRNTPEALVAVDVEDTPGKQAGLFDGLE